MEVAEIIKKIYIDDGFCNSVDLACSLNQRGIKTRRGNLPGLGFRLTDY